MAEDSWPNSGRAQGAVTVFDHQSLATPWGSAGVLGAGDLSVSASGSSLQVTVAAGAANIQGTRYVTSTAVAIAVASNSSGLARVDRVVIRLSKSTGAANATVLQGTPGSGAPTPLNSVTYFDLPLARFSVTSGGLPSGVVDERRLMGGDCTGSTSGNTPIDVRIGHRWLQTDNGYTVVWNGNAWAGAGFVTAALSQASPGTLNNASDVGLTVASSSPASTNPPILSGHTLVVPTGGAGVWDIDCHAGINNSGPAAGQATLIVQVNGANAIIGRVAPVSGTSITAIANRPMYLSDGDVVSVQITIGAAGIFIIGDNGISSYLSLARRAQ